jgi:hypothetical protein
MDKEKMAFEGFWDREAEYFKEVAKESFEKNKLEVEDLIEYLNNCIDLFGINKHYQEDEITNSISAIFLFYSFKQLRWVIHEILSGAYFEAIRNLRFIFETVVWAHFLDEWIDGKTKECLKAGVGAEMSLKYEILELKDDIYDAKGYRKKKNERELIIKETVGKFIEKHAQDFTNEGKEKYKELYFETLKNLGIGFSGKNGLIAKLPLEEGDKEKLDKLYSELSKYTHPSHRILKPFYEVDPGLIFTFGFEQKLFNDCFKFLGKVMDLSYAVLYIHFERLREGIKEKIVAFCRTNFNMEFPITEKLIHGDPKC